MSNSTRQVDPATKTLATLLAQAPAPSGVGTYGNVLEQLEVNDPEEGDPTAIADYTTKSTAERARVLADGFLSFHEIFEGDRQARALDILNDLAVGGNVTSDLLAFAATQDIGDPTTRRWGTIYATSLNLTGQIVSAADRKDSVRFATNATLPAATLVGNVLTADANGAFPVVDGVTGIVADRMLNKDYAASDPRHGLYTVTDLGDGSNPWVLTRSTDADTDAKMTGGVTVPVNEGTANEDTLWQLRTDDPIVLNTTAIEFGRSGGGTLAQALAAGNTSGASDIQMDDGQGIVGTDDAVGTPGGLDLTAGSHTSGGAGVFDGGGVTVAGGQSDATSNGSRGGIASLLGGDYTGTGGGTSAGGAAVIAGGAANTGGGASDGGPVTIDGGIGQDRGGPITITGGRGTDTTGGDVSLIGGRGATDAGNVLIQGGLTDGGSASDDGGDVTIESGDGTVAAFNTGQIFIQVPQVGAVNVAGGSITVQAGNTGTRNVPGGDLHMSAGDSAGGGSNRAGDLTLDAGDQTGGSGGVGGKVIVTPGTSSNSTDGFFKLAGAAALMMFDELASIQAVPAGDGALWVRSDTPTTLVFTDEDENDRAVSRMEPIEFFPEDATLATSIPFLANSFDMSFLGFDGAGASEQAFWQFTLPPNYGGQDLTFRIHYSIPNSTSGDVVWQVQFRRVADGQDLTVFAYDTVQTVTDNPLSTIDEIHEADITIPASALDGAVAGDRVHMRMFRDSADVADTYASDAQYRHGTLLEV